MEDDKQNQPVAPTDESSTQQGDDAPAPQPNSSEHAGNQDNTVNGEPSPAPENSGEQHGGRTEEEFKRLQSKVSKLEKEKNRPRRRVQETIDQSTLQELDRKFSNDPAGYEAWRANITNQGFEDPGSWTQVYRPQQAPTQNFNQSSGQSQEDIYKAIDRVHEVKSFVTAHPEFDPNTAQDEDEAALRRENIDFIMATAASKQALARRQGKNISRADAIKQSLIALDPDRYLQQAQNSARLAGRQDAYASGNGTSATTGGSTSKGDPVVLNDEDRAVARQLGLSEAEMLEQKKESASMPKYS